MESCLNDDGRFTNTGMRDVTIPRLDGSLLTIRPGQTAIVNDDCTIAGEIIPDKSLPSDIGGC